MIKAYAVSEPGGPLEPFEYDPGPLPDDHVEIDVEYCGICHSDLSMIHDEWGMTEFPFVPGHEVAGTVVAAGDRVTKFSVGDRVGLGWHSAYCNECHACMSGDHNLCANAEGTIVGRHGGFAEKVRAQAASVIGLPDGINSKAVGPLFCGGITVYNPMKQFNLEPTARVAVVGIGGLGHMAVQFLSAWGCEVTAFTSSESKRKEVLELGAHRTLDSTDDSELEKAAGSFDMILSTVNVPLNWEAYLATLKPKGRLHFLGAVMEPIELSIFSLLPAQRSVSASPVGAPATIAEMLDFVVRHDIEPMIELFDMEEVNEALEHLATGRPRYRIVLKN